MKTHVAWKNNHVKTHLLYQFRGWASKQAVGDAGVGHYRGHRAQREQSESWHHGDLRCAGAYWLYLASHHMTTEQNIIVNRIESVSMTGKEALRVGST